MHNAVRKIVGLFHKYAFTMRLKFVSPIYGVNSETSRKKEVLKGKRNLLWYSANSTFVTFALKLPLADYNFTLRRIKSSNGFEVSTINEKMLRFILLFEEMHSFSYSKKNDKNKLCQQSTGTSYCNLNIDMD